MNLHATRRRPDGTRDLYREHRLLRSRQVTREIVGHIYEDWCQDENGRMCYGYFWTDPAGNCGKTVPRLRDCISDFEREMKDRHAAKAKGAG